MSAKKDGGKKDDVKKDALTLIKDLYSVTDYMGKYGGDLWITAIICSSVVYFMYRQHIINILEVIKAEWPKNKCNPLLMPFAGFINKPEGVSNFSFTADNFSTCIFAILKYIAEMAVGPFQAVLRIINDIVAELVEAFNALRSLFDQIRNAILNILEQIFAAISNLAVEFMYIIIKMRDTLSKAGGVLLGALFLLFGAFMTMQSLFLAMIDFITLILIIIVCIIVVWIYIAVVMWGMTPIPIAGPFFIGPSTTFTVISVIGVLTMIAILIPVVIFEVFMMRVLKLSSPPAPKVPGCFAGDTLIPLFQGGDKKIQDIVIGDQLRNGGFVTATIQFAAADQNIYTLNGVSVTGEHRVFHKLLKWIKVKDHPDSVYNPAFHEPYVYCLNTTDKVFLIGDTIFSDWDDVDENLMNCLEHNCVAHGFLPERFTYADIHTCLDSGFHPETTVTLQNGLCVPISEIKVNDVLLAGPTEMGTNEMGTNEMGTKVLGVIKIAGHDLKQYKHTFSNDSFIFGTKNIHIADVNLGIINCMQSEHMQSEHVRSEKVESTSVVYHLLTDSKFFLANNIKVNDYNYGIDAYLKK
jgi:hypothetical protein